MVLFDDNWLDLCTLRYNQLIVRGLIMAKKQTFGDKASKQKQSKNMIKLVRAFKNKNKDSTKFSVEMLKVPDGKEAKSFVKEILSK